jgi:hypothetical protein
MQRARCIFALGFLWLAEPTLAQHSDLTPIQVTEAVRAGSTMKPGDVGTLLRPLTLARILSTNDSSFAHTVAVTLYTPLTWIQLMSAMEASKYRELSQVPEEMKAPVLRVFIKPAAASHLVLRDAQKKNAIQPSASRMCEQTMPFGSTEVAEHCQEFQFSLDAVSRLRAGGEFVVTVLLQGVDLRTYNRKIQNELDLKVNRNNIAKLPSI